jgi:damage-control phosphatase, subfamily I
MRIIPECLSCILDDIIDALDLLGTLKKDKDAVTAEGLAYLSKYFSSNDPPSYYITEMHRILKRRLNIEMPFSDLRDICLSSCQEISLDVAAEAQHFTGIEKLRFLIRWTIAANMLDFRTAGAGYEMARDRIEALLKDCFNSNLIVDHVDRIHEALVSAKNIVYVPDNVGELPFDKMLIAEIRKLGGKVIVPFRGGPITSDVVMADADAVALEEVADRIIVSGPDTLGISLKEMTEECGNALQNADVIIAKGQANFYIFSEFGMDFPNAVLVSLFVTKCDVISGLFGCKGKVNIAAVIKEKNGPLLIRNENV